MGDVDAVVVGAGVVGLACARELARRGLGVIVAERADTFGTAASSRNSEVLHAGLYYEPGTLKARLCVAGQRGLYAYATERGIPHRRVGKLVVATDPREQDALAAIADRAHANGAEAELIDPELAMEWEPELRCTGALWSPKTGIIDSHSLMRSLLADLSDGGGQVAYRTTAVAAGAGLVRFADGSTVTTGHLVNAAGVYAPGLAAETAGFPTHLVPASWPARGRYATSSGRQPFSRLIYPVPHGGGLGVHFTLDLGGGGRFGPDVRWVDDPEDYSFGGGDWLGPMAESIRRYWPGLPDDGLRPGYTGIRAKIVGPGEPTADFRIVGPAEHGLPGQVHLFGIESPGLTSCLAIAQEVADALSIEG